MKLIFQRIRKFWKSSLVIAILLTLFIRHNFKSYPTPIDLNQNGIWDDIEPKLESKYGNKRNLIRATKQLAIAFQNTLVLKAPVMDVDDILVQGFSCVEAAGIADGLTDSEALNITLEIRDIVITDDRQDAYIEYNAKLSGHMLKVSEVDESKCNFKILKD